MIPAVLVVDIQGRPDLETWDAEHGHPTFGMIVGRAGDADGDGISDFVVGDPGIGGTRNPPTLWIVSGKDGATIRRVTTDPTTLDSDSLGYANVHVDGGIDIDHDGTPDLLVAAQRYDETLGSLTLISVKSGTKLWKVPVHGSVAANGIWARFVQDRDGDGTPDLGLLTFDPGSPAKLSVHSGRTFESLWTCPTIADATENAGAFVETSDLDGDGANDFAVILGRERGYRSTVSAYSGRTGKQLWMHTAQGGFDLGCHMTLVEVGDLDGDRVADLAAGIDQGVEVLDGRTGDLLVRFDADHRSQSDLGFGASLTSLGDVDHDGWPELAIGETEWGLTEGCVRLKSGFDGHELWTTSRWRSVRQIDDAHHFGFRMASLGDVNGDGVGDLIVGTCESLSGEPGLARVISGIDGSVLFEIRRPKDELSVVRPQRKSDAHK